ARIVTSTSWSVLRSTTCSSNFNLQKVQVRFKKSSAKQPPEVKGSATNTQNGVSHLFVPVPVKATEKMGPWVLNKFFRRSEVKLLSAEHGLDNYLFHQAFISFRKLCLDADTLPVDLHILFSDISHGAAHVDDLFAYFVKHAKQIFPHLECMDDLKKISDLRSPANWYPEARVSPRKIVFHAGPTNSGKTYHALNRFFEAKSGVYCGPLKLLASEVFQKANEKGTTCDLVTGEERRFGNPDQSAASHVACTVEMTSVVNQYEVAIIDEIQMLRDQQRGWAWTRALLGVCADEVHLCGEAAAIELIKSIMITTGEDVEVHKYERLTQLEMERAALGSLSNVKPGDCIVCFSKNDIYRVSREIEGLGHEVAVIYGSLPPTTKLAQAQKFNDPENSCKILVATDAIGMGLNLSIRRVIFYSLVKPTLNERGEREMDVISTSQALQISGRAGRYGTQFAHGYVTTFKNEDLATLEKLLAASPETLEQAGLHPTADQIEMYAYHLPSATLSNLMDIFVSLCTVDDSLYFMCNIDDFKFLADMIQHVPLPLRARYVFCCAPINRKMPFVCTMFLKFSRQYSRNEPITYDWLCQHIGWPFNAPQTIMDLVHLESVFDVMDLYLWLSYRFQDLFPDSSMVRATQSELDSIIQMGVFNITKLLKSGESNTTSPSFDEGEMALPKKQKYIRGRRYGSKKETP
ncbi:ATP-dependent RNA helicase SUV3, mitochondrial, partial [Orchesella cincta]